MSKSKLNKAKPNCKACGLCCISLQGQEAYCDITMEDALRLPKKYDKYFAPFDIMDQLAMRAGGKNAVAGALLTRRLKVRSGELKGLELCACTLLRGTPLKKVSCAIYGRRPSTCRDAVKPGDKTCQWFRKEIDKVLEGDSK